MYPFYPEEEDNVDVYHNHEWVKAAVFSREGIELFEVQGEDFSNTRTRFDFRVGKKEGFEESVSNLLTEALCRCPFGEKAEVNAVVITCMEFAHVLPYEYLTQHLEFYEVLFQNLREDNEDCVRLSNAYRMKSHFHFKSDIFDICWREAKDMEKHRPGKVYRDEFHMFCHYLFSYHDGIGDIKNSPSTRRDVAILLDDIKGDEVLDLEQRGEELMSVLSLGSEDDESGHAPGLNKMPTLMSDIFIMGRESSMTNASDEEIEPTPPAMNERVSTFSELAAAENFDD